MDAPTHDRPLEDKNAVEPCLNHLRHRGEEFPPKSLEDQVAGCSGRNRAQVECGEDVPTNGSPRFKGAPDGGTQARTLQHRSIA